MFPDSTVKSKVKVELGVQGIPETVEPEVLDGTVFLRGKVDDPGMIKQIEDICWKVEGVKGVETQLQTS